jgi:DNA-binding phage protein
MKTNAWDSAEYLESEADRAAYLEICEEEAVGDPKFLVYAREVVARSRLCLGMAASN